MDSSTLPQAPRQVRLVYGLQHSTTGPEAGQIGLTDVKAR